MEVDSPDSSFSAPSSSPTRSPSSTHPRMPNPDPEKIASLAQKLYESLAALKPSKNKTNLSISLSDWENLVARSQQIALLTLSASRGSRDDALSLQIADMSDRITHQLTDLESKLMKTPHDPSGATTKTHSAPTVPSPDFGPILDGTRHSSLYLADGNLVVAAPISGNGGGTMLFRVHQSMLSLQSPVFAAMFTLPPPADTTDVYDKAPFVRMSDDAEDLESLFKVLYNPSELPYKRLDPLTPLNVRRTLAMATKYEMESLRDRIVAQLQADWPYTLAEWDRLEMESSALEREHQLSDDETIDGLYLDDRLPEPASAIRLAMDLNIPKILPSAVYHLSRLQTADDWFACRKEDTDLGVERTARWEMVAAADYKLLLKVRETRVDSITSRFSCLYIAPTTPCLTPDLCELSWRRICLDWKLAKDPLARMKAFDDTRPANFCKHCWSVNRARVRSRRLMYWDDICAVFKEKE
ncbi:BTB domain-containing protein [Favolaschia claudopus]|uniref:BTB domain-containing protein n=1 Tax=Favolaschia claudopus TaxID=2862362 RepID=A0AAW0DPE2_9AGAR